MIADRHGANDELFRAYFDKPEFRELMVDAIIEAPGISQYGGRPPEERRGEMDAQMETAAELFRQRCLLSDDSLFFPGKQV